MTGLSDGEKISMISSAVLIQYTCVTDRQTDRIGVAYTRYSIYSVARNEPGVLIQCLNDITINIIIIIIIIIPLSQALYASMTQ